MRFISMHKATKSMEEGAPPPPAVMAGMGPLIQEMSEAGVFEAGEGLRPSSLGVRVRFQNGKRTITKGPLEGENELIDRYLIVQVKDLDEAVEWASRFASGAGDSEFDIRPVTEFWDLGMGPKPASVTTTRYMILHKSDAGTESGVRPSPERMAAIRKVTGDMRSAGVLLSTERLQPSSRGVRLQFRGGKRRVIDGPFTESKELIAGFSIMNVKSRDEAVEWAWRFADLIGDVEMDIRPLDDEAL